MNAYQLVARRYDDLRERPGYVEVERYKRGRYYLSRRLADRRCRLLNASAPVGVEWVVEPRKGER